MASSSEEITPRALTTLEAGRYIGMSEVFLRAARAQGRRTGRTPGPPWVRIGRSVRYLRDDLDAWLMQHRLGAPRRPRGEAA
jgi:hypothetical protein